MTVPANFPIFATLPTGLNPLSLFDTAFGMILNGSAPVPIGSIAIGTTTVSGGTSGRVLYDNAGVVGELAVTGTGNAVLANNPALVTPNLGTPSAAVLTNATGLPIATGVSGLGAGVATFLATPTSANLAAALTDETGSGAAVFANSPALAGVPTAPTAAAATNTTQIATTAFVQGGYLPLPGGTLTGNLTVSKGNPVFTLNKGASGQDNFIFGQTNGLKRWLIDPGNATAEGGANAGSDFSVYNYDDTGAFVGETLKITRSTGRTTLQGLTTTNATGGDKGADTINATTYYKGGNYGVVQLGTTVTPGAVTSVDFTGIPAGVRRVVINFKSLFWNTAGSAIVQIGNGSVVTSGYSGAGSVIGASSVTTGQTTSGVIIMGASTGNLTAAASGTIILSLLDPTNNVWTISGSGAHDASANVNVWGGMKALSSALDRIRITTVAGTATVSGGSINISYE